MKTLMLFILLFLSVPVWAQSMASLLDHAKFVDSIDENAEEVFMGEVKIGYEKQLVTTGLGSCSALALIYKNKVFLSHVSPQDSPNKIRSAVNLFTEGIADKDRVKIFILPGYEMSNLTLGTIFGALTDAELIKNATFFEKVKNPSDVFGINKSGPIYLEKNQ